MVAKGLDFPKVSVAAALAADTLLNLPDWRAAERTYQPLSQLWGRAGRRGTRGLAIIQTYKPEALPVQAAAVQDYNRFYQAEMLERQLHSYPPYAHLLRILLTARELPPLLRAAQSLGHYLKQALPVGVELCGPAAAPLERIKDRSRWQIILKGADLAVLRQVTNQAVAGWQNAEHLPSDLRVILDVEPFSMF
jgi:primosomal protein N' (replication factor Y)